VALRCAQPSPGVRAEARGRFPDARVPRRGPWCASLVPRGWQPLPEHGVTTVFVNLGNTKIELLHPLGDNSPIANFLERNKDGGIHHICIEVGCRGPTYASLATALTPWSLHAGSAGWPAPCKVANIVGAIESLKGSNIRPLSPKPKIGAHNKPVVFLHPKDCNGVLVELEEA